MSERPARHRHHKPRRSRRHDGHDEFGVQETLRARSVVLCSVVGARGQAPADGMLVYVGTYTGAKSKGIHAFRFNQSTGALTPVGLVAETPSPSWLVLHPSGQYLYAANEVDDVDADKSGGVSAFRIDRATGALTLLNTQPSRGAHPCHLARGSRRHASAGRQLHGRHAGGAAARNATGRLAVPARSCGTRARASTPGDSRRRTRTPSIWTPATASRSPRTWAPIGSSSTATTPRSGGLSAGLQPAIAAAPGAGPRHFAFHPGWPVRVCHQRAEFDRHVLWLGRRARGAQDAGDHLHAAARFRGNNSTAEIRVHPGGRFVYGSNRGHDSIAVYQCRSHKRHPDAGRTRADARQDAPQLHDRSRPASGSSPPTRTATRWPCSASATETAP